MGKIYVTKTFLPPLEEYEVYLNRIWQTGLLTNQGPLLQELEEKVKNYLDVDDFQLVSNGTIALQLALHGLEITEGEVITTPFSYVATTSSILWERCTPVFVDIEPDTLCIDASKIEAAITKDTKAIMAVHVFGNPCDVETIETIANKHGIKVIYDGAHAFGVTYKGRSLLSYGDVTTCSFHATKLFHTIEGGGVFINNHKVSARVGLMKRFGHNNDDHLMLGINAKATEFQAAMGLVNIKHVDDIIKQRKAIVAQYDRLIDDSFVKPKIKIDAVPNYAYYPLIFPSEEKVYDVIQRLNASDIYPRRYFYPSLNTLSYLKTTQACPLSEDIAKRIICLPLYVGLEKKDINKICEIINT